LSSLELFFTINRPLVFFGYGLAFFSMGLALALQWRGLSRFLLAQNLWLLAVFGLLHGLAEWGYVFIPIQVGYLGETALLGLQEVHTVITALSFAFLLAFGIRLSVHYFSFLDRHRRWLDWVPALIMLFWYMNFIFFRFTVFGSDLAGWFAASDIWARYLMAFPGSLFTALGFFLQAREFELLGYPRVPGNLRWTAIVFLFYALVSGLVVPEAPFFPASLINHHTFLAVVGVPVQIFRAACGLAAAFFVIRGMEIFDLENRRRLEEAERRQTILVERVKVGRDLHDGLLQDIYGVSLRLEHVAAILEEMPARAKDEINAILANLDRMVKSVRRYIMGLTPVNGDSPAVLENMLLELVGDFRSAGITLELYLQPGLADSLAGDTVYELYQIAREALSNVRKHARATRVEVCLRAQEEQVLFLIRDNGRGFLPNRAFNQQHGLANMRSRAESLGGEFEIRSAPGHGTEIRLFLKAPRPLPTRGKLEERSTS